MYVIFFTSRRIMTVSSSAPSNRRPRLPAEVRRPLQRWIRRVVFASLAAIVAHALWDAGLQMAAAGGGAWDVTRSFGFNPGRIVT